MVGQGKYTLGIDHRGAKIKWPTDEEEWGGWRGACKEKRIQWSQIIKGEEKQQKILAILSVSLSAEICCCFSIRSSNGISLKCLKNMETPEQKFSVYFPCFSGFAGSEAGDLCLVAPSLLDKPQSNPFLEKQKALGCS